MAQIDSPGAAVAWSALSDARAAGQSAARAALQRLGGRQAACAIVFGSSWLHQTELLKGVRSALDPAAVVVGGSTAGEITPDGPKTHSCVVTLLADDVVTVGAGVGTDVERDPRSAGYQAAHQAVRNLKGVTRTGFLLFGDGLRTGYSEVLRGVQEVVGTGYPLTGALMGDDLRFANTYQYLQDQAHSAAVVGLAIGGTLAIGVGVEHGFLPISKPRKVTKANNNVLIELDGQPASSVYEEYCGASFRNRLRSAGLTRWLTAYPLGIQLEPTGKFLLRTVLEFNQDGSLLCRGEITEGSWMQLMIGSRQLALDAASAAAKDAILPLREVRCAIVFDSVMRKRLLGRDTQQEIGRIRRVLGPSVPVAGCYTYGEQTPLGASYGSGRSSVQTGACLVIALGIGR